MGFLKKESLAASYRVLPSGASITAEVTSGRVDVAQAAVSLSWNDLEKGQKPAVAQFAQINTRDGFFIAAREPDSDFNWNKLKSGQFMHVHGGQPEVMLRYAACRMGVDLDEVARVDIPSSEEMMEDYFTNQSPQAINRAIKTYQQLGTWNGDIHIPKDLYDNALNVFEHAALITRRHPYESVVVPPPA